MGACMSTNQTRGVPISSTTPNHLKERQVSQQLVSEQNKAESQTPQQRNTGVITSPKPASSNSQGFGGILSLVTPSKANGHIAPAYDHAKDVTNSKIHRALQKKKMELKDRPISFARIILKFEKLSSVLKDVKSIFNEIVAESNGGLSLEDLQKAMVLLEVEMTKEEISDLFGFIDLDGSKKIELKEFLVAMTIGMVLEKIPAFQYQDGILSVPATPQIGSGKGSTLDQNKTAHVKEMLNLIISAYLLFDPEGEGMIRKQAVEKILEEEGHQTGKNAILSGEKWKQMDWDMNGTIDFAEFVMAFSTWVDVEDVMT